MTNHRNAPDYFTRRRSSYVVRDDGSSRPANYPFRAPPPPYVDSVAGLDNSPTVVNPGMSTQGRHAHSLSENSVEQVDHYHPHPPTAAPPLPPPSYMYSSFLASLDTVDGLPSVLRQGKLAQHARRRTTHHGGTPLPNHADEGDPGAGRQYTPYRPGAATPRQPPMSAGATSPPAAPPRRLSGASAASCSSIQKTLFNVRRPDDARWGRD